MKPLKLTLQAFGSYIDRTEIDFERLGENRIFLDVYKRQLLGLPVGAMADILPARI